MAIGDYDPTKMKDVVQNGVTNVANTVQQAVTSGDYSNLSRDVSKELEELFGNIGRTVNTSFQNTDKRGVRPGQMGYQNPVNGNNWKNTETYRHIHDINLQRQNAAFTNGMNFPPPGPVPMPVKQNMNVPPLGSPLYADLSSTKLSATLEVVIGIMFTVILGLVFGGWLILGSAIVKIAALILCLLPAGTLAMAVHGVSSLNFAERFEKYVAILKDKTHIDVDTLAQISGRTPDQIRKDLKKMIKKGWFKQGHMEEGDNALITSHETFAQYQQATLAAIEREKENEGYTQEQRDIFNQGEEYVKQIRECNTKISDDEITAKLDRMEHSVRMIVDRAKQKPSLTVELHRLMNYYLPTMVKLLHSYIDLNSQDKTSSNIEKSKKEIESTIDLMNDAFDKMFDDLFVDSSLDISTDAEVLKQLLTQEGLTGHNFTSEQSMPFSAPTFPSGPEMPQADTMNKNG
ncbi:MAG: 5-bromo-4-chloroindolyl phosphate hydrolysis family protein [Lachnospiraceae bacterium]|nr:5-bromo-4-chloroindolyl phosphate hydrolysis family protein [Lachnospiraceae bacterium]